MHKHRKKRILNEKPVIAIRKKRNTKTKKVEQINIPKLISEYLMHSYLYYEQNESVISDHEFDTIVSGLLDNYDAVEKSDHIHLGLIQKQALESYTGFSLIGKFPNMVKLSALELLKPNKDIQELIQYL